MAAREPVRQWTAAPGEPTVGGVGEVAAIRAFVDLLPVSVERVLGPGDDAAVLTAPDGHYVVTSDSLVEGPDFRPDFSTPRDLGWKLAAVNLADVAAMGARPTALVVSLAVPPELPVAALTEIAAGIRDACERLAPGCGVEGGDLATAPVVVAVATAFGSLDGRAAVRRSGARPGDIVALAGELGPAAEGLRRLVAGERGRHAASAGVAPGVRPGDAPGGTADTTPDTAPGESPGERAIRLQLRPEPPVGAGPLAAAAGASAMIDLSDGLALDATRVADASGVTLDLDPALAPLVRAAEDHALLATFPATAQLPRAFVQIGRVVARDTASLLLGGAAVDDLTGWDPFRRGGATVV